MPSFKPDKHKEADKGKEAEREVGKVLEKYASTVLEFDYLRLPDARSAMGRMKAMPADFEFYLPGMHGLIEVKETAHDFRLTRSKISQLPMMQRRARAGGRCFVVIHHSTIGKWRRVPVRALVGEVPSWDLSAWPTYDSAMEAMEGFC